MRIRKFLNLIFLLAFIYLSCDTTIKVDEKKIHNKIESFYLQVLKEPSTFEAIRYSDPDTVFKTENQVKLKIKIIFLLQKELRSGDFEVTVTKDDIILLPSKEYEKFLLGGKQDEIP